MGTRRAPPARAKRVLRRAPVRGNRCDAGLLPEAAKRGLVEAVEKI